MKQPYVVGIDIGGTHSVFGIVNKQGEILAQSKIMTRGHEDFEAYLDALHKGVTELIAATIPDGELVGIGVGAPAVNHDGEISGSADLPWRGPIPLSQKISKKFGVAARAANDANAAAIGEKAYGAGKGMDNFIVITLGTGVGSGIVSDGHLIWGHRGLAGELGHVIRKPGGRQCGCGRKGCLETYCAARGIVTTACELLDASDEFSLLRGMPREEITPAAISIAAGKGDELSKRVFEITGEILGEACADFAACTAPEAIIVFGGIAKAGDLLLEPMRKAFEKNLLFIYKDAVKILRSELPEGDAAVLGASALGWEAI